MIKKTLLLIAIFVAGVLGFATTKPDTFSVQREVSIKAPPQKIAALLTDFREWQAWSPWETLDPGMQRTYSGPASGKGARYAWQGNDKVGAGRMEIIEAAGRRAHRDQARLPAALRQPQHHHLHPGARGRRHAGELDHDRPQPLMPAR